MTSGDERLECAMGDMLRAGVTAAALMVLLGGVLYLSQFHGPLPDFRHFHGSPAAYEHVGSIVKGVGRLDSGSLIELGILILIATPVCRVIFGMVGFALLKDRLYALVSAVVMAILLVSFYLGR